MTYAEFLASKAFRAFPTPRRIVERGAFGEVHAEPVALDKLQESLA